MHSFLYPFYVAGFAVAALAVLILGFVAPVRRANGLEKTARELNFKFSAFGTPFENTDVSGIAILENGPATVVANLLERTTGDCQFLICDVENCALLGSVRPTANTQAS